MLYSLLDLARATGVPIATLRTYVRQGIVPPLRDRRGNERFGEEQFYRACAANALRKRRVGARAMKAQLDAATDAELCAIAGLPPPLRQISPEDIERAHRSHGRHPEAAAAFKTRGREAWTRVVIRPGVELHVRADADEEARSVARAIEDAYGP